MPFINIKLTDTGVTKTQKEELIKKTTQILTDVLGKPASSTHVVIEEINTDNWGVGGESISKIRNNKLD